MEHTRIVVGEREGTQHYACSECQDEWPCRHIMTKHPGREPAAWEPVGRYHCACGVLYHEQD